VKACELPPGHTIADLGAKGVLDARFGHWARDAPFLIEVVQADDVARVRDALLGDTAAGFMPPPLPSLVGGNGLRPRGRRKPAA
jgi:hypothetical protein